MQQGIIYAIIAAISFGVWTVFHQLASDKINSIWGAIVVSLTAVIFGMVILIPQIKQVNLFQNSKGILYAVIAGVCAFMIDYFALKAYGSGLAISVAGPIIIGGSIAVASLIGFFMGEEITLTKVVGLLFVIIGSAILSIMTK